DSRRRGHRPGHRARGRRRGRTAVRRRERDLRARRPARGVRRRRACIDVTHFERALELAERGRGKVEDHPLVGAVVVRDGEVVGEGWYEHAKVDHAEPIALAQAGERARGATLYMTLEPCTHPGGTRDRPLASG